MYDFLSAGVGKVQSALFSLARTNFDKYAESRKVRTLVEEYRARASSSGLATLAEKLKCSELVDELISNETMLDIERDEVIGRFLGPNADKAAVDFVCELLNELDKILFPGDNSLASKRALVQVEEVKRETSAIKESLMANETDGRAQPGLLRKRVETLGGSVDDVDDLLTSFDPAEDSIASRYLRAYRALCTGSDVVFSFGVDIKERDDLVLTLVGVALSAGRLSDVSALLRLCSFEATMLYDAIERLLNEEPREYCPIEIEVPDVGIARGLIELMNFEALYARRAYKPAAEHAAKADILWNPIAHTRLNLSKLVAEAMFDGPLLGKLAMGVIGDYRDWFPDCLAEELKYVLAIAFSRMAEEDVLKCVDQLPRQFECFGQNVRKNVELSNCNDIAVVKDTFIWAEARKDPDLLLNAANRLVSLDEAERGRVISTFERNDEWAFPRAELLSLYATYIDQGMSYKRYGRLGSDFDREPLFHLTAYQLFREKDSDKAIHHIEQAINLMESPDKSVELLQSHVWVPYLIREERSEELIQLVEKVLPCAPYMLVKVFFQSVASCEKNGDLLDRLINLMAGSEIEDPRTAEIVASYLARTDRIDFAGRVALKAMRKRPTDLLAAIVAEWEIGSSLTPSPELIAHIRQSDTSKMNIVAAHLEREKSNQVAQNDYLIRAAFGENGESKRALVLFATWNAGLDRDSGDRNEVAPDTFVRLCSESGQSVTLVFPASSAAVKSDGLNGPAGTVFGTNSKEYYGLVGSRVGDTVKLSGESYTITEIGALLEHLVRIGFKEMAAMPGVVAVSIAEGDSLDRLADLMRDRKPSFNLYVDGVEADGSTVYFGIETGALIASGGRQLEFVLGVVQDQSIPFRRADTCRNCALLPSTRFLLSYNSIVVLSLLDLTAEQKKDLAASCMVTASTKRHLEKDAKNLVNDQFGGSIGRLGCGDSGFVMFKYDERTKQQAKTACSALLNLVDLLEPVEPSLELANESEIAILSDNEVIDVRTASSEDFVYVTEDVLEAQAIDSFSLCKRSSVSGLLATLGQLGYVLNDFAKQLREWGAEPVLEGDLQEAVAAAINPAILSLTVVDDEEG